MKIVVIGPTAPYRGGISHYNTLLCKNLSKKHKVELISWKRRYPKFIYPAEQLDKESKKKISSDARFILDCLNPFTWLKVFFIIKRKKPELLIFHWVSPFLSFVFTTISFLTKHFTKTRILLICHNVLPHEKRFVDKFLAKVLFKNVDYFLVHSRKDLKDLTSIRKNAHVKLGFMPLFDFFEKKHISKTKLREKLGLKDKVILFFGIVREYKGLIYLIRALPEVLKSVNLDLLIVGEFWEGKDKYLNEIKSLKLQDNVKVIAKYVPNEEVADYFSVSDILVLPYTDATQSAILQTAFAFDKPVITTNVGGLKEVVDDGKTGFIVKPENSIELAKAIIRFYKGERQKEFIQNIKSGKEKFSWESLIKIIESF